MMLTQAEEHQELLAPIGSWKSQRLLAVEPQHLWKERAEALTQDFSPLELGEYSPLTSSAWFLVKGARA